jgi:Zn-dependent oligopeptidase
MLENWCWEPQVLKRITSHYKTQEKLSDDLIKKLIARRVFAQLSSARVVR